MALLGERGCNGSSAVSGTAPVRSGQNTASAVATMGTPPPAGANQEQQQQQHDPPQQAHPGPLSSFLHNLGNLAKPATTEVLIARLGEGNVPLMQSRSCEALAKHAKVCQRCSKLELCELNVLKFPHLDPSIA